MLLATAAMCLALNIYHESRSESLTGQHAVAQVTMNRAGRDPKNICRVVTEKNQFSWTNEMVKGKNGKFVLTKGGEPKEEKAWLMAKSIANVTVNGYVQDFTRGATFYHTKAVFPVWRKSLRLVAVIGQHKFYRFS